MGGGGGGVLGRQRARVAAARETLGRALAVGHQLAVGKAHLPNGAYFRRHIGAAPNHQTPWYARCESGDMRKTEIEGRPVARKRRREALHLKDRLKASCSAAVRRTGRADARSRGLRWHR
eukprot:2529874-Pleurochrysis_carterae.AAC.1